MPAPGGQPGAPAAFRTRGAAVQAGRTVITDLPAMELRVMVMGSGWMGSGTVATRSGQTVEVRVPVRRMPAPGGR